MWQSGGLTQKFETTQISKKNWKFKLGIFIDSNNNGIAP